MRLGLRTCLGAISRLTLIGRRVDRLGDAFLEASETAGAQPGLKAAFQLSIADHNQSTVVHRRAYRCVAHPDLCQRSQIRRDVEIHIVTRVDRAEIDLLARLNE